MVQATSVAQFLIVVIAAWLSRQQEAFVEYLKAENRMLKARLGPRRIIFTDCERRLLARHARRSLTLNVRFIDFVRPLPAVPNFAFGST